MKEKLKEIAKEIDESKESLKAKIGKVNALVSEMNLKLDPLIHRVNDLEGAFANL